MASSDISNRQIFDAARALGFNIPDGFDTSGAQNSEFRNKVINAIASQTQGRETPEVWDQLKNTARALRDIPPDAAPQDKMLGTLRALGASGHQINEIILAAQHPTTPGLRQAGRVNDSDYADAVLKVLGPDNNITRQTLTAGAQADKLPAPAAPAPGAAPAPSAQVGNADAPAIRAAVPAPAAKATLTPAAAAAKTPQTPAPAPASNLGDDGTPKLAPAANQADTLAFIREHYGYGAWIFEQPDVANILTAAAKDGHWSPARINGALMATDFYKTHTGTTIAWMNTEANDPPTAKALVDKKLNEVISNAQTLGMDLDPDRARQIATDALRFGWDSTELTKAVGHEYHYNPTMAQKGVAKQIRDTARLYGVPMTDAGLDEWGRKVGSGDASADDFKATMINQAKSLFPSLAADLDRGATVKDIFDPYAKLAANTLGMDENSIDILDPKWQRPLQSTDGKNPTRMSTSDWSKTLRTDATYGWDSTDNARQEAADFAHKIRQGFGLA